MVRAVFIAAILLSAAFLILHWRLMSRLGKVEAALLPLVEALRNRLDFIVEWFEALEEDSADGGLSTDAEKLIQRCQTARDAETEELLKIYAQIEKSPLLPEWETKDEDEFIKLNSEYHAALAPYNQMIKKFPWKMYASTARL